MNTVTNWRYYEKYGEMFPDGMGPSIFEGAYRIVGDTLELQGIATSCVNKQVLVDLMDNLGLEPDYTKTYCGNPFYEDTRLLNSTYWAFMTVVCKKKCMENK